MAGNGKPGIIFFPRSAANELKERLGIQKHVLRDSLERAIVSEQTESVPDSAARHP